MAKFKRTEPQKELIAFWNHHYPAEFLDDESERFSERVSRQLEWWDDHISELKRSIEEKMHDLGETKYSKHRRAGKGEDNG